MYTLDFVEGKLVEAQINQNGHLANFHGKGMKNSARTVIPHNSAHEITDNLELLVLFTEDSHGQRHPQHVMGARLSCGTVYYNILEHHPEIIDRNNIAHEEFKTILYRKN